MSEFEETSRRTDGKLLLFGVIGVVVVGGCLLVCAGLAAVGFVVPAVMRQKQDAQRAANEAQQAAANAAARARAAQQAAAAKDDRPAQEETAGPALDDAPANDGSQVKKIGDEGSQDLE